MSAPAPPSIPPRPVKQQAAAQGVSKLPELPPRPVPKHVESSVSPSTFPQSPLNEPYGLTRTKTQELPARPPSVHHMPTPGEEGMEYANIQYKPENASSALAQDAGAQTRTIGEDLPMHAPKPSLPKASATAQVQSVTKTDLARPSHDDFSLTRTRSRQSFSRPDSAASEERRRSVVYGDEQGPAPVGLRVPINPLLGEVQAPTPQGMSPQVTGESPRRHSRRKSGVEDFRPPDSYGLHGHGMIANNKFERDWYAKHPEQLEHEEGQGHGVYEGIGSGRGGYALSSDELNKIVRDTASRGAGFGTKKDVMSYPDEQIGYMASETYQRSQQNTPQPEGLQRLQTHNSSQPAIESPLKRTSFAAEDAPSPEVRRSRLSLSQGSDKVVSDDPEETVHVDAPQRRFNKITGGQEKINETSGGQKYVQRIDDEGNEYTVPILAEDEVAKDIGGEYLHPAVSPKYERRQSQQFDDQDRSGAITPTSRPASRPGSIYQLHSASHSLSRFLSHQDEREHMHTPLEDVAEHEPLFEDDDDEKKAISHAERFKRRPDALQKRFPSQDIWEDTPSSHMYVAEVSTPDLPSQADPQEGDKQLKVSSTFEPPEAEHARKEEVPEEEKRTLEGKDERLARSKWAPHLRDDMPTKARPTLANRFPSQDVWEDSPDSSQLITTVGTPQPEDEASPVESKPPVPARPAKSRLGEGASPQQIEPSVAPNIPARPPKRMHQVPPADAKLTEPQTLSRETSPTEPKKQPSIPDRPKPQIPPRPGKKNADDELTKVTPAGSAGSAETTVKSKPQVPARPMGGNIASLKGNFMSDLNKKLGLGPPKEKEKEPELDVEAKPLEDARKGRARGPQRRAPAKSPAAEPKPSMSFRMFAPRSMWQINEEDELSIEPKSKQSQPTSANIQSADAGKTTTAQPEMEKDAVERPEDTLAPIPGGFTTNAAGESADPVPIADDENLEGELTRKTTASSMSGEPIEREESNNQTHMLPASRMTTANDLDEVKDRLEKVATRESEAKAEDEPIKVRNEQVSASAPAVTHSVLGKIDSPRDNISDQGAARGASQGAKGSDKPQEPMNENDIDYGKLEEMTAKADGKTTAEEDPQAAFSRRKVVD